MSEQEFENWLSLLSGLLKLSPEQRDNISDELRSHLEERMEDLLESGSSREEAIAAALEDFGDTASLAHHFTQIAHHHRRRRLMRYTYGTIAAMTCSILVLATFWPGPQPPMTSQSVAQNSGNSSSAEIPPDEFTADSEKPAPVKLVANPFEGSRERIEALLAQPLGEQEVVELPFDILMQELGDQLGIKIFLDPALSDLHGILDQFVTLEFPEKTVSAKTLIHYAIRSIGVHEDVGYTIRDNMVVITEKVETYETVIYNCNDLLRPMGPKARGRSPYGPAGGSEGVYDGATEESSTGMMNIDGHGTMPVQFGGPGLGEPGMSGGGYGQLGGSGSGGFGHSGTLEGQLIEVIVTTVSPDSWSDNGGDGAISSINGLIVVKHTTEVQEEVKDLLQKLRDARKE